MTVLTTTGLFCVSIIDTINAMNNTTSTLANTTVQDCGQITSLTWRGGISAAKTVEDGFVAGTTIQEAITQLDSYYVVEDSKAEARCIDGRGCSSLVETHLGAQVPGGTPGAAIAYRLELLGENLDIGNFTDDAHLMLEQSLAHGFVPGDHRDTHGHGIGCGAIDKMDAALAAMLSPELIADHKRLVTDLLGDDFSNEIYLQVLGAAVVLEGRIDDYMHLREKSIEELEQTLCHPVSMLEGDHHECLVVINMVSGTTFATKRFSDDFEGMQAFNYDVWRTVEFAEKLYNDSYFSGSKNRFIMARVMTAVATLMVLTDGSQRLIVRSNA